MYVVCFVSRDFMQGALMSLFVYFIPKCMSTADHYLHFITCCCCFVGHCLYYSHFHYVVLFCFFFVLSLDCSG